MYLFTTQLSSDTYKTTIDVWNFALYSFSDVYISYVVSALPTPEISFSDLGNVEWAQSAIINLAKAEIINGYDDGTFKPANT